MKKSFLLALVWLSLATVYSQTLKVDTAFGGQMIAVIRGQLYLKANDTMKVSTQWAFNQSFTSAVITTKTYTFTNDTIGPDTIYLVDTIKFSSDGDYYLRFRSDSDSTGGFLVTVSKIWVGGTLSLGKAKPTTDGCVQPVTYFDGYTKKAKLYVYVSPGDTFMKNHYLQDSMNLTGSGTFNYVFKGYTKKQYNLAYEFVLINPIDTNAKQNWITTLPTAGPAEIYNADSSFTTTNSAKIHHQVVTNGVDSKATTIWGIVGQSKNDTIITKIAGVSGVSDLRLNFTTLNASTDYFEVSSIADSLGGNTADTFFFSTDKMPVKLSCKLDTTFVYDTHTQRCIYKVISPDSVLVGSYLTNWYDTAFNYTLQSPAVQKFGPGVNYFTVDYGSLYVGQKLRIGGYAFNLSGSMQVPVDTGFPFIFSLPTPKIISFYAINDSAWYGDYDTIFFNTQGADEITIDGNTVNTDSGYVVLGPLYKNTTSTIVVKNTKFGTTATKTVKVVVKQHSAVILTFFASRDTIDYGDTAKLTWTSNYASSVSLTSFTSVPTNGFEVVTLTTTLTYTLTVFNPAGSDTKMVTIYVRAKKPNGIADVNDIQKLNVYPNPTNDFIHFFENSFASGSYEITNLEGQILMMGNYQNQINKIDVQNLPKGLYIIRVKDSFEKFLKN